MKFSLEVSSTVGVNGRSAFDGESLWNHLVHVVIIVIRNMVFIAGDFKLQTFSVVEELALIRSS